MKKKPEKKTTKRSVRANGGKRAEAQPFPCAWRINKEGGLYLPLQLSVAESKALRVIAQDYVGVGELEFCREAVVLTISALTEELLCLRHKRHARQKLAQLQEPMREIYSTERLLSTAPTDLTEPTGRKARAA